MEAAENLKAVAKLIEDCFDESGLVPSFREMVVRPLGLRGKILSGEGTCRWPLFVLLACESASSGSSCRAVPAAAAIELLTTALDIIDDLQDDDSGLPAEASERAQLLNVSLALIFLSQRSLLKLKSEGIDASLNSKISDIVSNQVLKAINGQHYDILFEGSASVTVDQALEMTALKAGSLVQCAVQIGAMLGTADEELIDLYSSFGRNIGIVAQLMNDLHDVFPDSEGKSDIRRGKRTVPIVFGRGEHDIPRDDIMDQPGASAVNADGERRLREELWQEGAVHFAWVLSQMHLYEAQEALAKIEPSRPTNMLFKAFVEPYL